ncbi:MAG: hypothetical protein WC236_00200 [Gallionellaceae bacterium]|jgi:hypothetical protein
MSHLMLSVVTFILVVVSNLTFAREPEHCGGFVKIAYTKLPESVADQRKVTTKVALEKVIPGDIIFFKGTRWNCPDGISGLVTDIGKGFIVFVIGVAEPKEQIVLTPVWTFNKGNFWYQLNPEVKTFEPETDPPRPGDKGYKPK